MICSPSFFHGICFWVFPLCSHRGRKEGGKCSVSLAARSKSELESPRGVSWRDGPGVSKCTGSGWGTASLVVTNTFAWLPWKMLGECKTKKKEGGLEGLMNRARKAPGDACLKGKGSSLQCHNMHNLGAAPASEVGAGANDVLNLASMHNLALIIQEAARASG